MKNFGEFFNNQVENASAIILSRTEGIIPAIESSHAVAHAMAIAPAMSKDDILVVNLSGRGDKDCAAIARYRGEDISL